MSRHINSSLFAHGSEVKTRFDLLGSDENSLTFSLGYAIAKSPRFLKTLIKRVYRNVKFSNAVIKLQESSKHAGFTDIEILLDNEHLIIIEAKKGWTLPTTDQLKRYLPRFRGIRHRNRRFVILSDCKDEFVHFTYPESLYNVPITPLRWADLIGIIDETHGAVANKEKLILGELRDYIKEVAIMENHESNYAYVVSLADSTPSWSKISWMDVVYKRKHYFYPQGKNWPEIPPNYIAFRFGGKLQTIHHVDKYEIVTDMHSFIPEIKKGELCNYYLLYLGEKIEPRKELPNRLSTEKDIWSNGRYWCMIDTLFTSKSIRQAIEITHKREKGMD